jgi:hypothetical protein
MQNPVLCPGFLEYNGYDVSEYNAGVDTGDTGTGSNGNTGTTSTPQPTATLSDTATPTITDTTPTTGATSSQDSLFSEYNFRDDQALQEHFESHDIDKGEFNPSYGNQEAYRQGAISFIDNAASGGNLSFKGTGQKSTLFNQERANSYHSTPLLGLSLRTWFIQAGGIG